MRKYRRITKSGREGIGRHFGWAEKETIVSELLELFRGNRKRRISGEPMTNQQYAAEKTTGASGWANNYLGNDPHLTLEAFQKDLTVNLIRTPRAAFQTCGLHEALAVVVERNRANKFDFLPVVEPPSNRSLSRNKIVGLIELVPFMQGADVGGHAPSIGRKSDWCRCEHFDFRSRRRPAAVSPDRLGPRNKRLGVSVGPAVVTRTRYPFAMVTHLEMIMADSIRREFQGSEDWICRLSPNRQAKVRDKVAEAKVQDVFVEMLLLTEFGDKVTLIKKRPDFCWGKGAFEGELNQVQSLRNNLAHANDYAATREAAKRTCETVRLAETWIGRLGN